MEIPKVVVSKISKETPNKEQSENTHGGHPLLFKAIITSLLAMSLPVLIFFVSTSDKNQDIRSKAGKSTQSPERVIYLPISFSRDESDDFLISVDKTPEIRNGFIPGDQKSGQKELTAILLDEKGNEILKTSFAPPDLVAVDGIDEVTKELHSELKKVVANNAGIVLPHTSQAAYVMIQNQQGDIINNISLQNSVNINNLVYPKEVDKDEVKRDVEKLKEINSSSSLKSKIEKILNKTGVGLKDKQDMVKDELKQPSKQSVPEKKVVPEDDSIRKQTEPKKSNSGSDKNSKSGFRKLLNFLLPGLQTYAANGTFNLAIIGDNYGGNNVFFQNDVRDLVTALLSVEPFVSNSLNIKIYTELSAVQICTPTSGWPSISCNDQVALQEASSIPYDKIYVLYNGSYTGYAYVGGVLAYGANSSDRPVTVKQGLFIHELAGHALGGLMDEYSYGTTGVSYAPNCLSSSPCSAWVGVAGLGCFSTCGYTNLYRATENNSVMNTAFFSGILSFDAYSTQIVQNKLSTYLQNPKLFGLDIPSTTPTPSLTPTPSPTLTPTTIPTSTPIPTSTLTPTPVPTIVPTSTPIPTPTSSYPTATPLPWVTPSLTPAPTPTSTPSPTPIPTSTPTPTPTSTPIPTPTSPFPSATPLPWVTPSLTPVPSPTPIPSQGQFLQSSCIFPNFCTAAKYCESSDLTSFNCGRSDQVCCKPVKVAKIESKDSEKETKLLSTLQATPTPVKNVFIPLPTLPAAPTPYSPANTFQPPQFPSRITPISTTVVTPVSTIQPQTVSVPRTVPNIITATPYSIQIPVETSVPVIYPTEIVYPTPIIVSPTSFNPETFDFERISPTPTKSPSFLGAFRFFFSRLFESWFPGLFR